MASSEDRDGMGSFPRVSGIMGTETDGELKPNDGKLVGTMLLMNVGTRGTQDPKVRCPRVFLITVTVDLAGVGSEWRGSRRTSDTIETDEGRRQLKTGGFVTAT